MRLAGLPGILIFQGLFQGAHQGLFQYRLRVLQYHLWVLQYPLRVLLYLLRALQYPLRALLYLLRVLQYLLRVLLYLLRSLLYLFLKTGRRKGLVLLFIFRLFGERRLISSVWLMCFMNWGFLRIRMGVAAPRRRLSGRLEGR